jgi:hypothetical protein
MNVRQRDGSDGKMEDRLARPNSKGIFWEINIAAAPVELAFDQADAR